MSYDQSTIWNGHAGRAWVDGQRMLDRLFAPIDAALANSTAASATSVLDVGCGTGSTTVAVAQKLGSAARLTGIDISEPMLAAARMRVARDEVPATFIRADAETHAFHPASFDAIVSRFGVMFFADFPRAFANLRRAARPGAAVRLMAWRSAAENPFMTAAERAAAPLLPDLPARDPDGPGQFAFADQERVRRILEESGWGAIDIRPMDFQCALELEELDYYLARMGPVGLILQDMEAAARSRILEAVRPAFDTFIDGNEVRFVAACWMIEARA
jgi:SAM-dependent methyltransferase